MMKELQLFDFTEIEDIEPLYVARLKIEEGLRQLKTLRDLLDTELIIRMKSKNVKSFAWGEEKIFYFNKKMEKITDTRKLKGMLFSDNEAERDLSRAALSDSESAWKKAKVREMQDTLGIPLLETSYSDEIGITVLNEKFIKGA